MVSGGYKHHAVPTSVGLRANDASERILGFFQEAVRALAQERAHDGLHDDSGSWFQLCQHLSISRKALACKSTTMMNVQHTIGGV